MSQTLPVAPGLLRRLIVALYESFLLIALLLVVGAVWLALEHVLGGPRDLTAAGRWNGWLVGQSVLNVLAAWAYFAYCWKKAGQTLAQKTWRIRVETADGSPMSWGRASLRFWLALAGTALFGATYVWWIFDRDDQFLHDRLAGTRQVVLPKANRR